MSATRAARSTPARLVGVDVARGLALVGMIATHVLPRTTPDGGVSLPFALASGRASALFAVLAGVGLALLTGGSAPLTGQALAAARRGVLARAAVIAGIGLVLGLWPSGLAVILVHYGLLFAVATAFLGLRARALVPLAVVWCLLAPVAAHALRSALPQRPPQVPSLLSVLQPVDAVVDLVLTGYYPVLVWAGYLLVGLAVGRLALGRARVAGAVLAVGAVAAAAAWLASSALLATPGVAAVLARTVPPRPVPVTELGTALETSLYGTTPTASWWWLAVRAPHAGTPPDLVHTAGTALVVLGACLLLLRAGAAVVALGPLAAAGSMTLTLYTAHVVVRPLLQSALAPSLAFAVQVVGVLLVAAAWRAAARRGAVTRRGPLEQLAADAGSVARGERARA